MKEFKMYGRHLAFFIQLLVDIDRREDGEEPELHVEALKDLLKDDQNFDLANLEHWAFENAVHGQISVLQYLVLPNLSSVRNMSLDVAPLLKHVFEGNPAFHALAVAVATEKISARLLRRPIDSTQ